MSVLMKVSVRTVPQIPPPKKIYMCFVHMQKFCGRKQENLNGWSKTSLEQFQRSTC